MAAMLSLPSGVDKVILPLSPEDSRRYFESICAQNPDLRLELTEEGHIILMAPVGLEGSYQSGEVFRQLANRSDEDGTGITADSSAGEKCRRYIKNGTREVWLLNPETR